MPDDPNLQWRGNAWEYSIHDGDSSAASCRQDSGHRPLLEGEVSIKESDGTYNVWYGALAAEKEEETTEQKKITRRYAERLN
jgi:hypothetical protein